MSAGFQHNNQNNKETELWVQQNYHSLKNPWEWQFGERKALDGGDYTSQRL